MRKELALENGKQIWVESFTGDVLEARAWSETSISSQQNMGFVTKSGVVMGGGTSIKSKTVEKREIWLRLDDGTEKCFAFSNVTLQARAGHRLTIVKAGKPEDSEGTILSIHQHTTNESIDFVSKDLNRILYGLGIFSFGLFILRSFIYVGTIFMFIGFVLAPVGATVVHFMRKPVKAEFKQKLSSIMPALLADGRNTMEKTASQIRAA